MLCATCGAKVHFKKNVLICKDCDSEFDLLDLDEELIPEPVFVIIKLLSQFAIVDTRNQKVYVTLDTDEKAELITILLNKYFAQVELNKFIDKYR